MKTSTLNKVIFCFFLLANFASSSEASEFYKIKERKYLPKKDIFWSNFPTIKEINNNLINSSEKILFESVKDKNIQNLTKDDFPLPLANLSENKREIVIQSEEKEEELVIESEIQSEEKEEELVIES